MTSVATCSNNYSATRRPDFTIIVPVSIYHHVSYAETYSRCKYARSIGLDRGYSAHSMRATFITTALDNGASLEDVQSAAGHADPSTTKLYDRRGYNPEKSASFFANY